MPKGRSQDACGFQGNRPSAPPLSRLGEMGVARSPKGNLLPPPHICPSGKQQGTKWRGAPPARRPSPPAPLGGRWCSSVGIWWGVATGMLQVWGGASSLRGHPPSARGDLESTPSVGGCYLARGPAPGGAAQCHARSTRDRGAAIRVHRSQQAPRPNKGLGNKGRNTGGGGVERVPWLSILIE